MVISNQNKLEIQKRIYETLDGTTLEDFLEEFDLTPEEVVYYLYESGHIDPELFERVTVIGASSFQD